MASNEKKSAPCNRSRRGSRTSLKGRDTFLDPKDIEEGIRDITPVAMVPDTPFPSPVNFGIVSPGVFRSGYPVATNFDFIRGLELKTMLTLVKKDELDNSLVDFNRSAGIQHIMINMQGTKKEAIPPQTMHQILEVLLDTRNHPVLLHCNQGKHRTGCVVAAMRMVSGWTPSRAVDEYRHFAEPKVRDGDVEYITTLNPNIMLKAVSRRRAPRNATLYVRAVCAAFLVMCIWLFTGNSLMRSRREKTTREI